MEADLVAAEGDLEEDHLAGLAEAETEILKETTDLEDQKEGLFRCMMQLAVNVESNVRFHSGQQEAGLSFAVIVSEKVMVVQAEVQERIGPLHQVQEHLQINSLR